MKIPRITKYERINSISNENTCGTSFSQNLSLAIKHENYWCAVIIDFFHFDFCETKD